MGTNCNVTPLLKIFLITTDLTWPTLTPPHLNFMDAICHVTPVLNYILDLCRFDLMYLSPPAKFHRCNLLHYTCVKWYFRSMQIWLDIFDPPAKIHRCNLLCYTCVKLYFRSMQIWLDVVDPPCQNFMDALHHVTPQSLNQSASSQSRHNKKLRVTEAQHNAGKKAFLVGIILPPQRRVPQGRVLHF